MRFTFFIIFLLLISSCTDSEKQVNLNFKMSYDDAPLVMLDDYQYPDGRAIRFTRISFYMSDLIANNGTESVQLMDVDMINLSQSHSDLSSSQAGYTLSFPEISVDDINSIQFNIGLTPDLNSKEPMEYDPNHPLANTGEYWLGWESYIFAKIEGFIDLDNNGDAEQTFALHLGSDEIMRTVQFENPEWDEKNETATFNLDLDIKKVFDQGVIYDIVTTTNIHSLNQIEQARFLIDNWSRAFSMTNN